MLHATPLLAVCLTLSAFQAELSGLPPYAVALDYWRAGNSYVESLQKAGQFGSSYNFISNVHQLHAEGVVLRDWWGHATDAQTRWYGLATRLEHAREAKQMHDWQLYGYPPCLPFWRLPHASALALPKRLP